MHYSHKVGSKIGTIKFVVKVKDNKDEGRKLVGIVSCEENKLKFGTLFCKLQVRSAIKIFSKSMLMSINSKASNLIKVLTDQSKIAHSLSKSEMRRLLKDLAVVHALKNEDVLTDTLLDCKTF